MVEVAVGVVGGGVGVVGMAECPLGDHYCGIFGLGVELVVIRFIFGT